MINQGFGLRMGPDTPTPNPTGRDPSGGNMSDVNITWLSLTGLSKPPNTPRRQQVIDMLGSKTATGDIPHLLSALKLQLQALGPPKSNSSTTSSLATLTGNGQEGPVLFKFDQVGFQYVPTLADFCHRVATTQAAVAPALAPEAIMAGVHVSIQEMEAKMEESLTEKASTLAAAIDCIAASVATPPTSFAQAATSTKAPAQPKGPKQPRPAPPNPCPYQA